MSDGTTEQAAQPSFDTQIGTDELRAFAENRLGLDLGGSTFAELAALIGRARPVAEIAGYHIIYDNGTSIDYKRTEREAHAHARQLVVNGWLDVNVRTLAYATPNGCIGYAGAVAVANFNNGRSDELVVSRHKGTVGEPVAILPFVTMQL
jgi:hypothetical protein